MASRSDAAATKYLLATSAVRLALVLDHLDGHSANQVARSVKHIKSRPTVLKVLQPGTVFYDAVSALHDTGLIGTSEDKIEVISYGDRYVPYLSLLTPYRLSPVNRQLVEEAREALATQELRLGPLPASPDGHDLYIWRL